MRMISWIAAAAALIAALAAAQMPQDEQSDRGASLTPATAIPDIPAGDDPMGRQPDPATASPAAAERASPKDDAAQATTCKVQRAATDTGFIVVCE